MTQPQLPPRPESYTKAVALVLQGGGALGSYQGGVYQALAESDYLPDWIAGISIGAINSALIAGNAPEHRVSKLREFWEYITQTTSAWPSVLDSPFGNGQRQLSATTAMLLGQPGFFEPRSMLEWWSSPGPISYYKIDELKSTLERLVDFDRINARQMRFSVGAVNVRTGNFMYFNNDTVKIRPEHVMASGALPPGFPAVEIDGEQYWDGGLVSNTPLQYVLDYSPRRSRLTFQVDLFQARGQIPTSLEEVNERDKDIRYSSRTRAGTDSYHRKHDVRYNINAFLETLPDDLKKSPQAQWLYEFGCVTTMDVAHLIYRPSTPQGSSKDYEFGRATMEARWAQGYSDARETLLAAPWLSPMPDGVGMRVFDVMRDRMAGKSPVQASTQMPEMGIVPEKTKSRAKTAR